MQTVLSRFKEIRSYTEKIFSPLVIEDYVAQPVPVVSPPKWSLGHTSWFFETFILKKYNKNYIQFNPLYAFLFNSYYNNEGDRVKRNNRGDLTRPTVHEVYQYRAHVDGAMCRFIEESLTEEAAGLIELGLQHEQQHQELFWTDLKYIYSLNPMYPVYDAELPFSEKKEKTDHHFHRIEEGIYRIGFNEKGFCYDNELGYHKVFLQAFEISDRLVTNADYMEFINDGGYQNFNLWHDDAWRWLNDKDIRGPLYWEFQDGRWMNYTLKGLSAVEPENALCHVSFYEAFAYAEWKGLRLPTEFEWEVASGKFQWGKRWEWTQSAYLPYPGYKKAEGAVGEYNGKFMINQMVLRGASVVTSPGHSRKTYRNFFHPWEQWQFSGIRLVK